MGKVRELLYGTEYNPYEGIVKSPFNPFGWNSNDPAFFKYVEKVKPALIIEVGTYFGGSARNLATFAKDYNKNVEIVCIDTFLGSVEHWHNHQYFKPPANFLCGRPCIYEQFMSNVLHLGLEKTITPFAIDSINGALTLQRYGVQADLIYIDAGHEYESVSADLRVFKPLLRSGGVMILDDNHYPPIKQAAAETLPNHTFEGTKIIWQAP